jgi:glycosyltransferase involved in cell wall biosynthesis
MEENEIDYLYMIKAGDSDGYVLDSVPTLVHAVFCVNQPHGHKYFYVSDWLAKNQGYSPETHSIPHICEQLPYPKCDFRQKHNIPSDVTVFGCYGGYYEFNISWVKDAIKNTVQNRSDIFFIYMNIEKFIDHPNVIFLEGTSNLEEKSSFVHACDAMIHARSGGETFGLAVSEFALSNKPIVTFELSGERSHIEILGDKGIYYKNYQEVYDIINNLENYKKYYNYYEPYLKFNPIDIMNKFEKLLLK